jgi:cytochrome c5
MTKILFAILCIASTVVLADLTGSLSKEAIEARLKPEGSVSVSGVLAQSSEKIGQGGPEKVYQHYCSTCHATGFAGAPVHGKNKDWAPRAATGLDTLVEHAWGGYKAMPAKGTCTKCTKEEIHDTVKWLIDEAK